MVTWWTAQVLWQPVVWLQMHKRTTRLVSEWCFQEESKERRGGCFLGGVKWLIELGACNLRLERAVGVEICPTDQLRAKECIQEE